MQAITRGIQGLDADEDLRANFEAQGVVQAAAFSPEAYQERLRGLYSKVGLSA